MLLSHNEFLSILARCCCTVLTPVTLTRYALMKKCWREDPQERPQFAELVKTVEDMLGVGMDYLDLDCLAGVSNREYFLNGDCASAELLPRGKGV